MDFDISGGDLPRAIVEFGKQARVSIVLIGEPAIGIRSQRIRGRLSVDAALRRLLAGTGFVFRRTAAGDLVVVRGTARERTRRTAVAKAPRPPVPEPVTGYLNESIVVTASKQDTPLSDYPGSVTILDLDGQQVSARPDTGTGVLIDNLPLLATTSLGAGRNKLFARGVADSSFNGQSQANVSMYFGDVRLNYSGPDPNLNLFDVRRVEVLAGPYGTLYGAGALGGVVRIEPNAPNTARPEATLAGGLSVVRHGGTGNSGAGMLNLPLVEDRLAIRAVGYWTVDPGYIDDTLRGLKDVNQVVTAGGRANLRFEAGSDLDIDMGGVFQVIRAKDSQYSNDEANPLRQQIFRAQPYASDYLMASLRVRKSWGDLTLVSATGWSSFRTEALSDRLGFLSYPQTRRTDFLSHESRLSGQLGDVRFLAGISFARNIAREDLGMRVYDEPLTRLLVSARTDDIALFGEAGFGLMRDLEITVGGRLNYIHYRRRNYFPDMDEGASAARGRFSVLPGASLAWKPVRGLLLFAAYRPGSRGGNIFPLPEPVPIKLVASKPDRLATIEMGGRYAVSASLQLSSTISYTRWQDVQSDLVTNSGAIRTINLGRTQVWGLEGAATWRPVRGLSVTAAYFLNNAPRFTLAAAAREEIPDGFLSEKDRIPNIAAMGGRATLAYETGVWDGARLRLAFAARYYGRSVAEYGSAQPDYAELGAEARLMLARRWTITLGATNLSDVRGNRFAVGNHYAKPEDGYQATPLQPRTLRLGVEMRF